MTTNLFDAHQQWATRSPDERFWTLDELLVAARGIKERSRTTVITPRNCQLAAPDSRLRLRGDTGTEYTFGHFSFGQLCKTVGAPTSYMRTLPAELVTENLNYSMRSRFGFDDSMVMLTEDTDQPTVRAFTSEKYARIWHSDIAERILPMQGLGWRTPPARTAGKSDPRARPATEEECLKHRMPGLGINPGDMIAPAGNYLSDANMFVLMVNENRPISAGNGSTLYRGFMLSNSEVGERKFVLTTFLYNGVCGNHIIWGAQSVERVAVRHIGQKAESRAFEALYIELSHYRDQSALETEAKIRTARVYRLGETKEDVVNSLFAKGIASKSVLLSTYDMAERHPEDGGQVSPASAWGMVQGMTRLSQQSKFMDERVELDLAAGKILQMAS